jgi:hypothetical protein
MIQLPSIVCVLSVILSIHNVPVTGGLEPGAAASRRAQPRRQTGGEGAPRCGWIRGTITIVGLTAVGVIPVVNGSLGLA